jgi:hypothetical protein
MLSHGTGERNSSGLRSLHCLPLFLLQPRRLCGARVQQDPGQVRVACYVRASANTNQARLSSGSVLLDARLPRRHLATHAAARACTPWRAPAAGNRNGVRSGRAQRLLVPSRSHPGTPPQLAGVEKPRQAERSAVEAEAEAVAREAMAAR